MLIIFLTDFHCTSRGKEDHKSTIKENWSGSAFLADSLEKASKRGLSPFKKGDIDSFRLYLDTADSIKKGRWLSMLYLDALYGVDDPEECIELIIKHTLQEKSLELVIYGLSDLNSIVGYGNRSYRNINFAKLIRDRNRFRTIIKKHPQAICKIYRLFATLHDPSFKNLAIKELMKFNFSDTASVALWYLIHIEKSIEEATLIDKLTSKLLSVPPDSFYESSGKSRPSVEVETIGDDTVQMIHEYDPYMNWLESLTGFFISYGEAGIPYLMKYLNFNIPVSIKDRIAINLGILEERIHKPAKSPPLLVEILSRSKDNRTLFLVIQLCGAMRITAAIPYLKRFLAEGQKYTQKEMYFLRKCDLADHAELSLYKFGYKIQPPKKRPGFHKIIYEPPEYKKLK